MQQLTQDEIVKIQSKGLITIPKKIRENLGLDETSLLRVREEKGRIVVEPLRTLPYPIRRYTGDEIKNFIEFDKHETKLLRRKGMLK